MLATRARLQAAGTWEEIVRESDKARAYQRAMVKGEVEDADASPLASRVVATVLSPALKAAASQRSRADGGLSLAFAQLLEDGATRTTDPYEADLFFVPIFGYYTHSGNMNAPTSAFDTARMQRTFPGCNY